MTWILQGREVKCPRCTRTLWINESTDTVELRLVDRHRSGVSHRIVHKCGAHLVFRVTPAASFQVTQEAA